MTFSICAREHYETEEGASHTRFGVAVTTRLAGVGTLCPFVSENGAVATQSLVNVDLGRKGIEYVDDGLAVEDALQALLNADEGAPSRQLHGVDAEGSFVFSGEECNPWYGHHDGGHFTVAGNLLVGEEVVDAVVDAYASSAPPTSAIRRPEGAAVRRTTDHAEPLSKRLIDALAAGHAAGGDKREDLTVQSAALLVADTEERPFDRAFTDLRVDATESPIADLRETYRLAVKAHADAMAKYEDEYEADEQSGT